MHIRNIAIIAHVDHRKTTLVDAAEGPLPQTRFVLKKALDARLKIILFINKIDKKDACAIEVQREVENLFLDIADNDDVLDFTTLYGVGRDDKVYTKFPKNYLCLDIFIAL